MGRRSLRVSVLAFMLALAAPAAGGNITAQKERVDGRIADLQHQVDAAKAREGVLTTQLTAVGSELRAAQSAVDKANRSLARLEGSLATQQARLDLLSVRLKREAVRLERLQKRYERALQVLGAHVRAMYMSQPPDVLSVLVSARSVGELIDDVDFMNRIGLQDEHIADRVARAKASMAAERRATLQTRTLVRATVSVISARTAEARRVRDRLVAGRDALLHAKRLKSSALAGARETREGYLAEVNALASESAALTAQIQAAQSEESPAGATVSAAGLIWPVNGPVTSGFGMRWGHLHPGIDIAVPVGTPVHAAAAGTVIFSGWMSGYGFFVVIDHGNLLATAYGHNSALLVSVGTHVAQGQVISLSGSTGNSTGPHVHFEVRVNGVPVDPLLYL